MTDPVVQPTPEPVATAPVAEPTPSEDVATLPQWARDAISKANREAAAARVQVNELKPKADQFAVLEEASKSDAQRLQDAAAAATRDAETARAEATRYKVAATYKIGADHFDLLGAGTEEEITARAVKVSALLAAQEAIAAGTTKPVTRPVEQLRPGATPGEAIDADEVLYQSLFGAPK